MNQPLHPLLAQALERHNDDTPAHLTRPLFAAAITHLALHGHTPDTDGTRAAVAQLMAGPKGPDWHSDTLGDFLSSYQWHLLFARCPQALELVRAQKHYRANVPTVPVHWQALLEAITPADLPWIQEWQQVFSAPHLLADVLMVRLGDPAWDTHWAAWLDQARALFTVPTNLINHPAIAADPDRAFALLEPLFEQATANFRHNDVLDSIVLAMLARGHKIFGRTDTITPSKDHKFALNTEHYIGELMADAQSQDGAAALRAAFPTARDWWAAGPQGRAAHWHSRVFAALTPPALKTARVPVQTQPVKEFLATKTIALDGIKSLVAFEQRCHQSLADGLLSDKDTQRVSALLESLRTTAADPAVVVTVPEPTTEPAAYISIRERKKADDTLLEATLTMAGNGHGVLANKVLAQGDFKYGIDRNIAIQALKNRPNLAGLAWVHAHVDAATLTPHLAPLLNAHTNIAGWEDAVLNSPAHYPDAWVGAQARTNKGAIPIFSFLTQGGPWLFKNPAHRHAWFAQETAKPASAWDLNIDTLARLTSTIYFDSTQMVHHNWQLAGVLRMSLALRDGDSAWMAAFTEAAQRIADYGSFDLLNRWKGASTHQRMALSAALRCPQTLLAQEHEDVCAMIKGICP